MGKECKYHAHFMHLEGSKGYIVTLKKEYKAMPTSENRCCVDKIT